MKIHLLQKRLLLPAAALLALAALLSRWPVHVLLIEHMPDFRPVFMQAVRPGDIVALGYLHSVEHCHVRDFLKVGDDFGLSVTATEFPESRTGLPYAAFKGETFEREADRFRIGNMHRPVPEIWQWVNAKYENTLEINGGPVIRLPSLAGDCLLHIRTARLNALQWAWLKVTLLEQHRS